MRRKDGKVKQKTYLKCDKCDDTISTFAYSRHYKTCKGFNKNLRLKSIISLNNMNIKKIENDFYVCLECNKEYSKKAIGSHYWRLHTEDGKLFNPNKYFIKRNKIIWNKGLTKETDERIKKLSIKTSESLKKSYRDGKINLTSGGFIKWYNYKNIKVQGTYELRACYYLDFLKENNKIKNWEYTKDKFPYIDNNGNKRTYLLDFKIITNNDNIIYIETKGREFENDYYKWKAVKILGYKLKVWRKKDLKRKERFFKTKYSA
jgi:hypothetical protein